MKYTLPTLALLGVFLLQPSAGNAAQADANAAPRKPNFEESDTNKDGSLSKEEFQTFRPRGAEKFATIDKDGNGQISKEELKAWRDARRAEGGHRFFEECDKNKDGSVSKEEFLAVRPNGAEKFAAMDKDGNGLVSPEELKARRDARRGGGGGRSFEECDKNKDGSVSKEEFLAVRPNGAEKFAAMDKDGNGMVSQEEFKVRRDARRAEGGHRNPFEECDKNKDDLLNKEEFQACHPRTAEKFADIDKDGNGQASREELKAWWDTRRAEREAGTVKNEGIK